MGIAEVAHAVGDELGRQLAVGRGDGQELAAEVALGRPALVDVDVGRVRADHGLVRPQDELQREDVGRGAGQHRRGGQRAQALADELHRP